MKSGGEEREFTLTALVLGVVLAVVFGAANAYLGLKVGLTISASIPAAVISMGVLRFVLRRDSILENNMVQTIGSAGESLVAGAVFTMPALYLWAQEGVCLPPGVVELTLISLAGGVLGVLLMVPLRKPLIVDEDATLVYPEGRACAEVLRAGEKGARHAGVVFLGVLAAAAVKLVTDLFKWVPAVVSIPFRRIRGELGLETSAALVGVGYIVGPKVSTLVFSGSFFGWMVLIPLFCAFSDNAAALYSQGGAVAVWNEYVRFVGAGAIAAGGFFSLVKSVPLFVKTFRESAKRGSGGDAKGDIPLKYIAWGVAAVIVFIACAPAVPVGIGGALLMAFFGFFFAAVSARMVGLVGSSNNPISGMTIATLVVSSLALKACGAAGAAGMVGSIAIGSVVCIVAALAGDTAQDLKTGHIVGATPWKQQVGELAGAVAAAFTVAGVLFLLHKAWGVGSDQLSAPQATLMKSIVEGMMGGEMSWGLLALGAGIATVLEICRVPVMACALGIYLPVRINTTIFIGGMLRLLANRRRPELAQPGTLFSAGLVAGEGLCGIALALVAVMG